MSRFPERLLRLVSLANVLRPVALLERHLPFCRGLHRSRRCKREPCLHIRTIPQNSWPTIPQTQDALLRNKSALFHSDLGRARFFRVFQDYALGHTHALHLSEAHYGSVPFLLPIEQSPQPCRTAVP